MKIKELIEELKTFPEDWEVLVSIDEEGNGFNTLHGISICNVDIEDIYDPTFQNDDDRDITFEEANAIVLWP